MTTISRTPILSVEAVAEWLALPVRTVQFMAASGQIRAAKLGRQWRFRQADVEAYLSRQFGDPTPITATPAPKKAQRPAQGQQGGVSEYVPVFSTGVRS